MPKSLKSSAGERIDLSDFVQGTNTYTQEMQKSLVSKTFLDARSRLLNGFRIRIEDQTVNPGLITIFNGVALDRDGQLVNNEDTVNDSRSLTLSGASTTFFLEVYFTEVDSTTDSRYFWDPTVVNVAPEPDGAEFALNVSTRIAPDWVVSNPPSTLGFAQSADPNSRLIPLVTLTTDGANRILVGDNPGLVLVTPASVLMRDVTAAVDNKLYVASAREFPTTLPFTITLDVGGSSPETPLTVNSIDRTNNTMTLAAAVVSDHLAGAIVRTIATAEFISQNTDPTVTAHPDLAQRFWQADEIRGSGLVQSKETFGARDDLNVSTLKDEIDFLSAQVREMKFGHPRTDVISQAPPMVFATAPRYFDRAGSIQGAKTNSVSIGNGTTSFGDFNGTTDAVFTAAIAALPALGGSIYVKEGTYTFAASVSITKSVRFVGDNFTTTFIVNGAAANAAFTVAAAASVSFENMLITKGAGLDAAIDMSVAGGLLDLDYCVITAGIRIIGAITTTIRATRTLFAPTTAVACVLAATGTVSGSFDTCTFYQTAAASVFSCSLSYVHITDSTITCGSSGMITAASATATFAGVEVSGCTITAVSLVASTSGTQTVLNYRWFKNIVSASVLVSNTGMFSFASTAFLSEFSLQDNAISVTTTTATDEATVSAVVVTAANGAVSNVRIERNTVSLIGFVVLYWSDAASTSKPSIVAGNSVAGGSCLVRLGSAANFMTSGEYHITDNTHDNLARTSDVYGVRFYLLPTPTYVLIARNTFTGYNSATGGVRVGVDATWDSVSGVDVLIEGNTFSTFGTNTTTLAVGVHFSTIATAPTTGSVRVINNKFSNFGSNTLAAGVLIQPAAGSDVQIQFDVIGNHIRNLGDYYIAATPSAYGIYLNKILRGTVKHNTITKVSSGNVAGSAASIFLYDIGGGSTYACGVQVAENTCLLAQSAVGATPSGSLIYAGGFLQRVQILNNICSQIGSGSVGRAEHCILVESEDLQALKISGNSCTSSAGDGTDGIAVLGSTTAFISDLDVSNNDVQMYSDVASWIAIDVTSGDSSTNLRVCNNTIHEFYGGNLHFGIRVLGHTDTSGAMISGNTLAGIKSGAFVAGTRIAIQLIDCISSSVCNNLVDWGMVGVATGGGISISSNTNTVARANFVVTGNIITPTNSIYPEIYIETAFMTEGLLHANVVGDSTTPGTITAVGGGWIYGDSAPAADDFNKYS